MSKYLRLQTATFLLGSAILSPTLGSSIAQAVEIASTPESFQAEIAAHLENAQKILDEIAAVEGDRTVENTLVPLNDMYIELDAAGNKASLTENVHPDENMRGVAETATQEVQAFVTELSLNPEIYLAVEAVDVSSSVAVTQRFHDHTLRDYRRAGVDKDEATRNKVKALREELVTIGQEFDKNIRDARGVIELDSADELEGLPEDYVAGHEATESGKIEITTSYPDYFPVMQYSENPKLREELYLKFTNRAFPENREVLNRLIEKRNELANTLGYSSWAEFITEDKMSKNPENVREFIEKLNRATERRGASDYALLVERKKQDFPDATDIGDWERHYYSEKVKSDKYSFDSQELRPYYNYPAVKQGILDLNAQLFSVTFKKMNNTNVWDPSVDSYEMYEGDELIGRFYLDMHPRDGKFSHAAQFTLQSGVKDRQVPEAVLVCNFPAPDENGVALMEHDQVETFLHEFGHLIHTMFGGHQMWIDQSGIATERDFAEAPSQMLEEWALDPSTLQTFAKHYETGEQIPAELIAKLRASKEFGNGLYVRQQNFYTAISLNCYDKDPSKVDLDAMVPELQAKYSPYSYVPGSHMYASFGHLEGYSAMYYTYMWSLVIAKDMFSKFNKDDLLNSEIATEYRRKVLEPGGTEDAAKLVEDFLGRPYGFDSFALWLEGPGPN